MDDQKWMAQCGRKVLQMMLELHLRGYQQLRIVPSMSPSGTSWRCAIAPSSMVSREHGARPSLSHWDHDLVAWHTIVAGDEYFGWTDARHETPSGLARVFIERFPRLVAAGEGSDWSYVGWYVEMLHLTYPHRFPIAFADWETPDDRLATIGPNSEGVFIPLPPPGLA